LQTAKQPPNHTQARAELDRAIKTADQAYNAELTQFGRAGVGSLDALLIFADQQPGILSFAPILATSRD